MSEIRTIRKSLANIFGADMAMWPSEAITFMAFLRQDPLTPPPRRNVRPSKRIPGRFWTPSPQEILDHQTKAGGWLAVTTTAWGITYPPLHGWRNYLGLKHAAIQTNDQGEVERLTAWWRQKELATGRKPNSIGKETPR